MAASFDSLPAVWTGPPSMTSEELPPTYSRARQVADDFLFSYRNQQEVLKSAH